MVSHVLVTMPLTMEAVSAQATIVQLQEKWSEKLMASSPRWLSSSEIGTSSSSTSSPEQSSSPTSVEASPAARRMTAMKPQQHVQQKALYNRYGPALHEIQTKLHQVSVTDTQVVEELQRLMRVEKAVTNAYLHYTICPKLLLIRRRQIMQQRELAQQLQALNQANQEALLGNKKHFPVTPVTPAARTYQQENLLTRHDFEPPVPVITRD